MASVMVIASSTINASAMIKAPSEMRCMSMLVSCMTEKTTASVSGIESAMISPGRTPRLMKLTTRMIPIACHNDPMNSPIAPWTVTAWSDTKAGSMPIGRFAVISFIARLRFRPSARISPPSRIAMARPMAGCPLTRNCGCGGSA